MVSDALDDLTFPRDLRIDTRVAPSYVSEDIFNTNTSCMYIDCRHNSPNQLLMPHIDTLDFIPWPAFREFAVQIPAMQERMEWVRC
jgi:hypothetical protein